MEIEIKVPAMGESISQVSIGTLIKNSGEMVNADEEVIELETDKANQALYAPESGVITWKVSPGDTVDIGTVIGIIDTSKKPAEVAKPAPKEEEITVPKPEAKEQPEKKEKSEEKETPEAEKMPEGASARITKEDFLTELTFPAASSSKPQAAPTQAPLRAGGERIETHQKMSKIRKVIAQRLVEVMQQTAMLTTFNEADMTRVIEIREKHKEAFNKQYGARLGFMSFFIKAVVSALQAFPEVNTYVAGDDIVYRHYYDIGVAVGTDKGVIVPVIRNCDVLSFADIEKTIEAFAKKAREGGLSPTDLQGGSFTITNGGIYGSLLSTPILNPPQSAILGMHKIIKRPVVIDDQMVIRSMMYLALSYDHRVIDGKEAVSFLVHIKNMLEDPSRLIIGI